MLERAAEELERGTTCHLSRATIEQHFDLAGLENGLPEVEQAIQWMTPDDKGHPDFQIDRVKERTPILKALGRLAALMREMKRCLSEGLEATPRISFFWDEENVLRYRLTGCRSIHKHWIGPDENDQTPVILLDATPKLPLIRHFFPNLALGSDVQAATPHARFVWMQGKFWHGITQKNAIEQHRNGRKGKEHAQSIEGLRWTLWRHWLTAGCKPMLAVFSKALHDYLDEQEHKKSGFLPPGCELAHQGATRGRNSWETVRTVLIFGRMLPSVEPIEMTAEAMTGRPIQRIEKKKLGPDGTAEASHFHIIEKDRILPNGRIVSVKHYHHPDPVADGFLQAMVAGEAIQAAARGRAVNRTSDNPLEVFVYADTYAADMPLDDVQEATGPTAWDQMALSIAMETGQASDLSPILISSPTDAAKAYPRIWSTPKAAERGFDAGNHRPPNSYNNISIGIRGSVDWDAFSSLEGFTLARYQPEGARQKPRLAWVPIGQEIGFQSWIEQALCCDVRVEWVEVPQPDPTPPEPSKPIRSPAMAVPVSMSFSGGF
ncbi:hypothetical protein [Gluconacetobacter entanii]|uniref:hypothetical protein n=1 Tax=Gluconacetobacter entanii TaxID=108528 RepID=UPI0011B38C74|nr:hypothetical protein [Gluconacetobacter entanii]